MLDRIKQTTSTVGTGTYALNDAPAAGFRTLRAAKVIGGGDFPDVIPYAVILGADWEVGYGAYNGADPGTVVRTAVLASSTGAEIDWPAGDKEFIVAPGAWSGGVLGGRNNIASYDVPTVADDKTLGYHVGSMWVYFSSLYFCTDDATGAAVWAKMGDAVWKKGVDGAAYLPPLAGSVDYPREGYGHQLLPYWGYGGSRRPRVSTLAYALNTFGAGTGGPTVQIARPGASFLAGAAMLSGTVVAHDDGGSTQETAMWKYEAACRTQLGSPFGLEIVGTPVITLVYADTAFASAAFNVTLFSAVDHQLRLEVNGVSGRSLGWSFDVRINEFFWAA